MKKIDYIFFYDKIIPSNRYIMFENEISYSIIDESESSELSSLSDTEELNDEIKELNNSDIVEQKRDIPPCPGRNRKKVGYCIWYVAMVDRNPSLFTMCEFCYNNLSEIEKKNYVKFKHQSKLSEVNCDSEYSHMHSGSVLHIENLLIYINDTINGTEAPYSKQNDINIFDVPTASHVEYCIDCVIPNTWLTIEEHEFNGDLLVPISEHFKNNIQVSLPFLTHTLSNKEIELGVKQHDASGILKLKIQKWNRRSEQPDDIIPRSQFERIGNAVNVTILIKSSQSEEELYNINTTYDRKQLTNKLSDIKRKLNKFKRQYSKVLKEYEKKYGNFEISTNKSDSELSDGQSDEPIDMNNESNDSSNDVDSLD